MCQEMEKNKRNKQLAIVVERVEQEKPLLPLPLQL